MGETIMKLRIIVAASALIAISGTAIALQQNDNPRAHEIVEYFIGHTHDHDGTHGAPQHSGGTDSYGCHNGSIPYHCH